MPYTFEMTISGIVAVVRQNGGARLRVVAPDTLLGNPTSGRGAPRTLRYAIDGRDLLRHDPAYIVGRTPSPLRGHRLVFRFAGADARLTLPDDLLLPKMSRSLQDFAPEDCHLAAQYAEPQAGDPVAAILDIERGQIEPLTCGMAKLDTIRGTVYGAADMAYALRWTVEGLQTPPSLQLQTLEGADVGQAIELQPDEDDRVRVGLLNHRAHPGQEVDPRKGNDEDFRWFFEFLEPDVRSQVIRILCGRSVPVPTQVRRCAKRVPLFASTGGQLRRPCEFGGPA